MGAETEGRFFNLAAAKDLLRNVACRTLKYTPRSVIHALVGAVAGVGLVGLAFLSEQSAPPDPQIPQLYYYDRERISAVNRILLDRVPWAIAGFAVIAVIFGRAAPRWIPWIDRKLTSWEEERDSNQ